MKLASARTVMFSAFSRAIAPRKRRLPSEWAARHRRLTSKGSSERGRWNNARNPLQVEIMDCASSYSPVREVVALLPIQFGKSEILTNILGYTMTDNPMPVLFALPAESSMNKMIDQKINNLIDTTDAVRDAMVSLNSRETSNRRTFKDFEGGQLFVEHAGAPVRLKSISVGLILVDEFSSFANELRSGDDPVALLDGRTTAFPRYKRFKVGTPETIGNCRLTELWEKSDQRRWYVPCPDCGHEQPLTWSGLQWTPDAKQVWYACRECGVVIEERSKGTMIAAGRWVPERPGARVRGYHANALYYPLGLGLSWQELVQEFIDASNDPARLKTFVNDRLAEGWQDKTSKNLKPELLRDRAEPYRLGTAPHGVLCITAGVDTQDNRLAVQIVGWGRDRRAWVLDYVELPGDPADNHVWNSLTDLLNSPIPHACGALLTVQAVAIDMLGHRTEFVKNFVRQRRVRRPMAIFGSRNPNAPALSRPRKVDFTWEGKTDPRGATVYSVGTVDLKHQLFAWLGGDAEKPVEERRVRFSDQLDDAYFGGLIAEVWNPRRGRYEPRRGSPRNEPLDTFGYALAATQHPDLRLHRATQTKWDELEKALQENARAITGTVIAAPVTAAQSQSDAPAGTEPAPVAPAMSIRNVIFEIVGMLDRTPEAPITTADLDRWRHVAPGTLEENRLHATLFYAVNAPGEPIATRVTRDQITQARTYLSGLPSARLTRTRTPQGRRVRSRGI